ncbi:MAG: biotin transporter BioY [Oscillospiraceae bacterium]
MKHKNRLPRLAASAAAILLMCLVAPVSQYLSFTPMPLSLGTLVAYLAAALAGPLWGCVSVLLYILLGLAGLHVFPAYQSGFHVLAGPIGGYVFGLLPLVYITGLIIDKKQMAFLRYFPAMLAGAVSYYLVGALWLASVMKLGFRLGFELGVRPFLLFELVKIAVAGIVGYLLRSNIRPLLIRK